MEYNIYCDESCHLEHDGNDILVLGGICCPKSESKKINNDILLIKDSFDINREAEIKWTKVSPANVDFYTKLVRYFFDNNNLSFRGYVGRGKTELDHNSHNQTYNDLYYKLYYRMLEFILDAHQSDKFNIYVDIKDTIGSKKVEKLKSYFNNHYTNNLVNKIQLERSEKIGLIQLADLFIGALSYKHRYLNSNLGKLKIIELIEDLSAKNMLSTIPVRYKKVNWFIWTPDSWR